MTQDPLRLIDTVDAPDAMRTDLRQAIDQPALAYDMTAGLARLEAAIAGAPGSGTLSGESGGGSLASTASTTGGAAGGGAIKLGAIALGVAVTGVAAWLALGEALRPDPAVPALPVDPVDRQDTAAPDLSEETARPAAPTATGPAATSTSAVTPVESPSPAPAAPPPLPFAPAPNTGPPDVARELAQMVEIRRALATDPGRALTLADAGQRRFRRGMFVEEREASAVLALSRLGRPDATRARAARFLRRYPESPFAERVRQLLGSP
jgi:hypothetical protein